MVSCYVNREYCPKLWGWLSTLFNPCHWALISLHTHTEITKLLTRTNHTIRTLITNSWRTNRKAQVALSVHFLKDGHTHTSLGVKEEAAWQETLPCGVKPKISQAELRGFMALYRAFLQVLWKKEYRLMVNYWTVGLLNKLATSILA